MPTMPNWDLPRLTDYWDPAIGAIHAHSRAVAALHGRTREDALSSIARAVQAHTTKLSDQQLQLAAFVLVEHLYRSLFMPFVFDQNVIDYLAASAGTFSAELKRRGYLLHYLIDNTFVIDATSMRGPLDIFPDIFVSAGIRYVCPQHIALRLMNADSVDASRYFAEMRRYIAEARCVGNLCISDHHANHQHYVLLDVDAVSQSFEKALAVASSPGVITVYRDDPPVPPTTAKVTLPTEPLAARSRLPFADPERG